ncbi:MAG: hypothetical protein BWX56_00151 [Euryarchaeota archaeon ADurb.Bin023]|jgi:hypothetical protein|nr:MAG: hypothetical protein BWX56_00151 [Euryarchaeota archaeon ADurb.Bin023]
MRKRGRWLSSKETFTRGENMEKRYTDFEMRLISYYDKHKDLLEILARYDDMLLQAIALSFIKNVEDIKKRN